MPQKQNNLFMFQDVQVLTLLLDIGKLLFMLSVIVTISNKIIVYLLGKKGQIEKTTGNDEFAKLKQCI